MKKLATAAALSCAILATPAVASAAPAAPAPAPIATPSGSAEGGSSNIELICSPIAQFLFATGSVEKPPLYDILCMFS